MPNPAAACAAIDDLVTHKRTANGCIGLPIPRTTSTTSISGTYAHRPFHLKLLAAGSWCGEPAPVLRDYWILSTFPCATLVTHTDNGDHVYADWAHKSGCTNTT